MCLLDVFQMWNSSSIFDNYKYNNMDSNPSNCPSLPPPPPFPPPPPPQGLTHWMTDRMKLQSSFGAVAKVTPDRFQNGFKLFHNSLGAIPGCG